MTRTAAVATGCAALTVAFAAPASAEVVSEHLVQTCNEPRDQVCGSPLRMGVRSDGEQALVQFTADSGHCSALVVSVYQNSAEVYRQTLGPGQTLSTVVSLDRGESTIGIAGEGFENGCNTGVLGSWEGDLRITGPI